MNTKDTTREELAGLLDAMADRAAAIQYCEQEIAHFTRRRDPYMVETLRRQLAHALVDQEFDERRAELLQNILMRRNAYLAAAMNGEADPDDAISVGAWPLTVSEII